MLFCFYAIQSSASCSSPVRIYCIPSPPFSFFHFFLLSPVLSTLFSSPLPFLSLLRLHVHLWCVTLVAIWHTPLILSPPTDFTSLTISSFNLLFFSPIVSCPSSFFPLSFFPALLSCLHFYFVPLSRLQSTSLISHVISPLNSLTYFSSSPSHLLFLSCI